MNATATQGTSTLSMDLESLEQIDPTIPVSNCAECGELLVAKPILEMTQFKAIAGRIYGRPYCSRCLTPRRNH